MPNFISVSVGFKKTGELRIGMSKIRFVGLQLPDMEQIVPELQRAGFYAMAAHWLNTFAPEHFKVDAFSRYGGREERVYVHRKKEEIAARRKRATSRKRDLLNPLVSSGNLRAEFLAGLPSATTRKTNGEMSLRLEWRNLPRYAYLDAFGRNKTPGPKIYAELTVLNDAEEKALAKVFEETVRKELKQLEAA